MVKTFYYLVYPDKDIARTIRRCMEVLEKNFHSFWDFCNMDYLVSKHIRYLAPNSKIAYKLKFISDRTQAPTNAEILYTSSGSEVINMTDFVRVCAIYEAGDFFDRTQNSHSPKYVPSLTKYIPALTKVISSDPATIVFWKDGTKTVVKCQKGDTYDIEKGILYAIIRKVYEGHHYTNVLNIIDESCETYDHTIKEQRDKTCSTCKYYRSSGSCSYCDNYHSNWEAK